MQIKTYYTQECLSENFIIIGVQLQVRETIITSTPRGK